MKIVIIGCGKVGRTIAEQLDNENHDITVIDNNSHVIERLSDKLDVMTIHGEGASLETLREADIQSADLAIAVTDADELNIYLCLLARNAGAKHTIARVRNPIYHKDLKSLPSLKENLSLSMVINPERIAASEMARLIKFPSGVEIDTFTRGSMEIYTFVIKYEHQLASKKLVDLTGWFKDDIRICTVERDEKIFIPNGDFMLSIGDKISVICTPAYAPKFFKKINENVGKAKDVMIIGGSRTAYYLAQQLADSGIGVKIIEKDERRCCELSELLTKANIVHGDGMNKDLLFAEGIERMDAVVTLTNFDEENMMLSLYARRITKGRSIAKVDRIVFDELVDSLDLDSVIRPRELTAEHIVRYVRGLQNSLGSNIETLYRLNDGKTEALEFKVRDEKNIVSIPLADLKLKPGVNVVCINHRGKNIIPKGNNTIERGDTVIIMTTQMGLKDINDILA